MLYDGEIHWAFHCYTRASGCIPTSSPLFCLSFSLPFPGRPCSRLELGGARALSFALPLPFHFSVGTLNVLRLTRIATRIKANESRDTAGH